MVAVRRRRPDRGRRAWPDTAPGPRRRRARRSAGRRRARRPRHRDRHAGMPSRLRSMAPTAARTRSPTSSATSGRRVAQQDDELLAAVPGRHVVLADGPDDRGADRPQDLVADVVAVRVVEDLEPVDVDHEDADGVARPPAAGEKAAELVEVAAVREAGQRIGRGARLGVALRGDPRRAPPTPRPRPPPRIRWVAGDHAPGRAMRQDDRADRRALDGQRRGERVASGRRRSASVPRSGRRPAGGRPAAGSSRRPRRRD